MRSAPTMDKRSLRLNCASPKTAHWFKSDELSGKNGAVVMSARTPGTKLDGSTTSNSSKVMPVGLAGVRKFVGRSKVTSFISKPTDARTPSPEDENERFVRSPVCSMS